jgi:hypothetical protein
MFNPVVSGEIEIAFSADIWKNELKKRETAKTHDHHDKKLRIHEEIPCGFAGKRSTGNPGRDSGGRCVGTAQIPTGIEKGHSGKWAAPD